MSPTHLTDITQAFARLRAEVARLDSLPPGADPASQEGLLVARTNAEKIAAEVAKLPGPALDHWYAAGVALLLASSLQSGVFYSLQSGHHGECAYQRALALVTNIQSIAAYLLIERAGGPR